VFFAGKCWRIFNLEKVRQADGTTGTVRIVKTEQKIQTMYNLDIANLDNFYVGEQGWLVHNGNCPNLATRPFAQNPTFNREIGEFYRGEWVNGVWESSDKYLGGLAGAIRRQKATGELVGGLDHFEKGYARMEQLERILRSGKINTGNGVYDVLSEGDMNIARAMYRDLQKALEGVPMP
jgi:hypothetical protein